MARFFGPPTVDLTGDDDELNEGETSLIDGFVDLTIDSDDDSEAIIIDSDDDCDAIVVKNLKDEDKEVIYLRNEPVSHPFEVLDHWPEKNLKPGMSVELKSTDGKDGDFIRIQDIISDNSKEYDNILIRGQLMRRAKYVGGFGGPARLAGQTVGGKMKRDLNELALVFEVDQDDPRPAEEQALVTRLLSDVLCTRHVIFTHEDFPRRSFRERTTLNRTDFNYESLKQSIKEAGVLVCRNAYTEIFQDTRHRLSKNRRSREGCLRRIFLSDSEFTPPRAEGSQQPKRRSGPGPVKKRQCTYGSGCCGAGGDSEGARLAGATVEYGWDCDESACASFSLNHPSAKIYCREADSFPQKGEDDACDILHLSWPCDYFSPNHTREGKNDDANTSAIFGTYQKLTSAKPRIHTQENTFGIDSHHPEFMGAVIQEIVRAGYNVRWKVDQFADYGSPASRKRVVIMAARIGVPLPEFPKPTHGPGSGLAYRTVHDAINKIPDTASWHLDCQRPYAYPKSSYDPRTAKSSCITRNGGKHPHPSGKRPFTPREMASLQGFPESYQFTGTGTTEVRKQIGNAIPPNVWKHYIRSCVDTLEKFDAGLIDEAGRTIAKEEPVNRKEESVKREQASASSAFTTPPRKPTNLNMPMHSSRTIGLRTPSRSNTFNALSGSSASSTHSSASKSMRNLYRASPSPALHKTRGWSGESHTLSPESSERTPSTRITPELSAFGARPSPFKRKIEPIDLTGERKMAKTKANREETIDLTEDDWEERVKD